MTPTNAQPRETRDTMLYELALEHAYKRQYSDLVAEAQRTKACTERDLLQLGRVLVFDLVRLARGEISSIHIPNRLPHAGEFAAAAV